MADKTCVSSSDDEEDDDWKSIIHEGHQLWSPVSSEDVANVVNENVLVPEMSSLGHGASEDPVRRMNLNDHKAGMEGLDKERINQIIFEVSKGSKFYENEKKKEERVVARIKAMKEQMSTFSDLDFKNAKKEAKIFSKQVETERDLSHIIVHIDMDAFYAAVETRDNPKFKDVPMAVGSYDMLCTSNYVARKFGVRAGMPGFIAKKLCPNLTLVPMNFKKYREVSNQVQEVISQYDPNFCTMGLDEAYLDITDYIRGKFKEGKDDATNLSLTSNDDDSFQDADWDAKARKTLAESTVNELRERIFKKTNLTASAGIACNVMLAKVCSDMNKPNGQYYLPSDRESVLNFVKDLPIRKVCGIGRVSEQILNELGITVCGDLYERKALLFLLFSTISFQHFLRISLGVSSSILDSETKRKSISSETTFQEINDPEKLLQVCHGLCESLANDLQKENLAGKCITVKFKFTNFEVKTSAKTLSEYVNTAEEIFIAAREIIKTQIKGHHAEKFQLRLLGVRVSEFGVKKKGFQNTLDSFLSRRGSHCTKAETNEAQSSNNKEDEQTDNFAKAKSLKKKGLLNFVICPVCQISQSTDDINLHIDSCLNKQAIKKILSADRQVDMDKEKTPTGKSQKRKLDSVNEKKKPLKKATLQSFWNSNLKS